MLQFTTTEQAYPATRDATARAHDFKEISPIFEAGALAEQAARCSQCGVPFCQVHCPLSNNIPDWLSLAAQGRIEEAYAVSSATNNFPEICGRICPQDKLCEGNCVIEKGFGAVTIGAIEKTITETAFAQGWVKPIHVARETGQSVGIIGAGPAGLAAADMLRREGHRVVVYDRYDRSGGLMIYGIPNFKLDKTIVARRDALLRAGGIQFQLGTQVGTHVTLDALRARHDVLLIATGVYKPRALHIPGEALANVLPAMEFLTASNRMGLGDSVPAFADGTLNAAGKEVVVIGGGDTAMDCVRTAMRQGAKSVTCLYRRDRANMPGSDREVGHAEAEGVNFAWLASPRALAGEGAVQRVEVQRMALGAADALGRKQAVAVAGDTYTLAVDMVIKALGYDADDLPVLFNAPELAVRSNGTLKVDAQFRTSLSHVYAAGDIVRGASLVVWAIKDGRDVAAAIHQHLVSMRAGKHVA